MKTTIGTKTTTTSKPSTCATESAANAKRPSENIQTAFLVFFSVRQTAYFFTASIWMFSFTFFVIPADTR